MIESKLDFKPIIENKNLVPSCIYEFVEKSINRDKFLVAEIDPKYADGEKLCQKYLYQQIYF